jgi:DNA-binding response OmpR family regulator
VIGRERLLELSRTRLGDASDRSIDVLVSRLRRKLAQDDGGKTLIRTMRGTGYMFAAAVERL